eukprot:scaffold23175_cov115-Isochrysis_galbana.AAC.1
MAWRRSNASTSTSTDGSAVCCASISSSCSSAPYLALTSKAKWRLPSSSLGGASSACVYPGSGRGHSVGVTSKPRLLCCRLRGPPRPARTSDWAARTARAPKRRRNSLSASRVFGSTRHALAALSASAAADASWRACRAADSSNRVSSASALSRAPEVPTARGIIALTPPLLPERFLLLRCSPGDGAHAVFCSSSVPRSVTFDRMSSSSFGASSAESEPNSPSLPSSAVNAFLGAEAVVASSSDISSSLSLRLARCKRRDMRAADDFTSERVRSGVNSVPCELNIAPPQNRPQVRQARHRR